MAQIQLLTVLAAPSNYPGVAPTAASPCPLFGATTANIQGVAVYSNAANPTGHAAVNYHWWIANTKFTGTLIVVETQANIISAS